MGDNFCYRTTANDFFTSKREWIHFGMEVIKRKTQRLHTKMQMLNKFVNTSPDESVCRVAQIFSGILICIL